MQILKTAGLTTSKTLELAIFSNANPTSPFQKIEVQTWRTKKMHVKQNNIKRGYYKIIRDKNTLNDSSSYFRVYKTYRYNETVQTVPQVGKISHEAHSDDFKKHFNGKGDCEDVVHHF